MLCDEIAKKSNAAAFKDATLVTEGDHHRRAGHDRLGELVARLLGFQQDCVMDEAHLVNADFRGEFKDFCDRFLQGVEQKWIFFEHNVVTCINNVYHDWEITGTRKEVSRRRSLANQIKEYEVPPAGNFPGHQGPRKIVWQEPPKFKDCEEAAALSWLCETARTARNIGFDGRMFLTEAEWLTYCRRKPVRYIRTPKTEVCQVDGLAGSADNPLQNAHIIGFDVGVIDLGLTPGFLDSEKNIITAHRQTCNKQSELNLQQSMEWLWDRGVRELPSYLPAVIHEAWRSAARRT